MDKFRHKKSLGQNFLHDETIINKIVSSIKLNPNDLVIEIGPGKGALTKKLQEFNVNLICYELDKRTKPYLEKIQSYKTHIKYQDFLTSDVVSDIKKIKYKHLYIVANIPYYITTPIIKKIINSNINVEEMILMMQDEVANRFSAIVGTRDYGAITVFLNYYFQIEKLFEVPASCFNPMPNVNSAVVKFSKRNKKILLKNENVFFQLVRDSFKFKRKNLKNNLKNYDLTLISKVLKEFNLSLENRAEEISLEVFAAIANNLA